MKALPFAAALVAALSSHTAFAACYVVYGPNQDVIYRAVQPPVDMSRQIHETLPLIAPGASMVFTPDTSDCESPVNLLPVVASQGTATTPPAPRAARADRG